VRTILFVHQSSDLYGSDRVLLDIVLGVRDFGFAPIVVLPTFGPLKERLLAAGVETHELNVAKLSRGAISIGGLFQLPISIAKAVWQIDKVIAGRQVALVHSNTLAVLGGAIWAKWRRVPHIWHVHELVVSPWFARAGFPWLVQRLAGRVMFNSSLTAKWMLDFQPHLRERMDVVWNGVANPKTKIEPTKASLQRVTVALVGRINRLKGQLILVEAASRLWERGVRHVNYVVVGSAPAGQEHYLESLRKAIEASPARDAIAVKGFTENVWPVWENCDIAVVPSTEPESFGLVAIEAMALGKPVVATAHGGILDIVVDGETGLLISPNDGEALADALNKLIDDPVTRTRYGLAGKVRQRSLFSLEHQIAETVRCYKLAILKGKS
jgi:glycosyltransferase involved in cell wall biosynthesis